MPSQTEIRPQTAIENKKSQKQQLQPHQVEVYSPKHKVRFVTATSLFDGHDASINIMRRILQTTGAEVIHLGHNRSVGEIVDCAIQEDAQGIAVSSYQGGHIEYFKYMVDLLREKGAGHIRVYGGGGGVIVEREIKELHEYGIARIFSPEDGRTIGLQGMINLMMKECDFETTALEKIDLKQVKTKDKRVLGRAISAVENKADDLISYTDGMLVAGEKKEIISSSNGKTIPVIGITGTGGAGKSSLTDELVRRFLTEFDDKTMAIISIDPSKRKTGGALLGDRIRMNAVYNDRIYMRSLATRTSNRATSEAILGAIELCKAASYDIIVVETSGIGQSESEIVDITDLSLYVMTSEYGAATQLEKINMLDLADIIVLNKFEKKGSQDALRDIRKQYKRNHNLWHAEETSLPVYPTIAAQFNDEGVNRLFAALVNKINSHYELRWKTEIYANQAPADDLHKQAIIPGNRVRYLSEISESVREYHDWADKQAEAAARLNEIEGTLNQLDKWNPEDKESISTRLHEMRDHWRTRLDPISLNILDNWDKTAALYKQDVMETKVRDKVLRNTMFSESLAGLKIPRVALPQLGSWGDRLTFALKENLPGYFPFTAGVFPFKREGEDPTRMFAGEGTPERTNKRFHFVSEGLPAKRLSTAFDSVTLYGEDPDLRPDIYGKIGNSGVSICTLDDMKKLYSGFHLTQPTTSVSMTINGPAPMILAMFMNTAIDQEVERWLKNEGKWEDAQSKIDKIFAGKEAPRPEYGLKIPENSDGFGLGLLGITGDQIIDAETYQRIKAQTLSVVRGTVQADILKEDQAQNTCIFSTEFALKMMGDIQKYFTTNKVRNYYSVSISGYHIAEAGANPVTQAAFTLANGFTFVEYYLSRGLSIDDFAHNLSFFFSNGLDPEYAVIGRVARRIWSVAMKNKYQANDRSQKLKYHIQTSGRSLHAQEIQFNDIRTTLQAVLAIYDNCNSLHTNAYDEAITTPTEESVRRALAIQLIINKELGLAKNENPNQGSYILRELTDLVEEAILTEFDRITDRGGVLGAMETMYQRGKIQDESLYYETLKHNGELPIIGVNTFLDKKVKEEQKEIELIRSTEEEKQQQINNLEIFKQRNPAKSEEQLKKLQQAARENGNIFEELMETVKYSSLGQISRALYDVGGQYRRNM
ncbi:MAG: methylmalonyl-CoA mutase family protein [Balneolales bacterium]|nr:methylmalonyl-CoA mutase family protein [Balneolales bacterium]